MKKLLIASDKGGVGKTTMTIKIAKMLSDIHNVGILDIDIENPNTPEIMNIEERDVELSDEGIVPKLVDNIEVMSIGLMVNTDIAVLWSGERRVMAIDQLMNKVDWQCDVLVIDTPAGTGDEIKSIISKFNPDGIIIVTTNHKASISGAKRTLAMINVLGVRKKLIGIIKNMTYINCTACGAKSVIFDSGKDEEIDNLVIAEVPYVNQEEEMTDFLSDAVIRIEEVL